MINKTHFRLLSEFFWNDTVQNKNTSYYINVMNNVKDASHIDKNHEDGLIREKHNHCHITTIEWFDMGNGFKSFDDRKWWYVTSTADPDKVEVRYDLIREWIDTNAKDTVLAVCDANNSIKAIPMQWILRHFGDNSCARVEWNEEGNIIFILDTSKCNTQVFLGDNDSHPETTQYLENSWQYLGNTVYARHRARKMVLVAKYDSNGKRVKYHRMKSLRQVYDICHFENVGAYRTFTRILNGELVEGIFVKNEKGEIYFITTSLEMIPPDCYKMEEDNSFVTEALRVDVESIEGGEDINDGFITMKYVALDLIKNSPTDWQKVAVTVLHHCKRRQLIFDKTPY